MSTLKSIWKCMFSPKLVKIYGNGPVERFYEPQPLERWGDQVIHSLYIIWKLGIYTTPFWGTIFYQRGYFEPQGLAFLTKFVTGVGVILIVSYCIRGCSRAQNPTYQKFLGVLQRAENDIVSAKPELIKYDFEFWAWPVEYDLSNNKSSLAKRVDVHKPVLYHSTFEYLSSLPYRVIAYLAIHTFGIRLVYPGSVGILQIILGNSLLQGRSRLIESYRGERFKLRTPDGNSIDGMFVERRNSSPNGTTLVICCEGNAGFYEIGTMVTPIEAGYSVLGWNHPGFGGSTGMPYPSQEQNAVDTVIQYAINKLGFKVQNIVLFGWSIGGYTTSWAAMNYPEVKGVVIDATFDDILPLAVNHMPRWWEPIVKLAIREYINLNIYEQLSRYHGPLLLIRRTEDEVYCDTAGFVKINPLRCIECVQLINDKMDHNVIMFDLTGAFPIVVSDKSPESRIKAHPATSRVLIPGIVTDDRDQLWEGDLSSNRGNDLLKKTLRHRYPCVYEETQLQILSEYLAVTGIQQERLLQKYSIDENVSISLLQSYISEFAKSYPMKIGEEFSTSEKTRMALFLASKYMKDFKSTHCVSLPGEMFTIPWDINIEPDFVFT